MNWRRGCCLCLTAQGRENTLSQRVMPRQGNFPLKERCRALNKHFSMSITMASREEGLSRLYYDALVESEI